MSSPLHFMRTITPKSIKGPILKIRAQVQRTKTFLNLFFFPLNKKLLCWSILICPRSILIHQLLVEQYFKNRKKFKNPILELRQFLKVFQNLYQLDPSAILKWRTFVYFAHLTQKDFDGMLEMMDAYFKTQFKLATERQLYSLGICICSENVFSNYNVHAYLDTHIKARQLGMTPDLRIFLLLRPGSLIANPTMYEYWKKYITIITCEKTIDELEPIIPYLNQDLSFTVQLNGRPAYIEHAKSIVQKEWEKEGKQPLFKLTETDIEFGRNLLEKYGIPKNAWFVSLHVRDAGYKMGSPTAKDEFDAYRNADVMNYLKAVESIVNRGGFVVRVGDPSMIPLPEMKGVFDYVHSDIRSNRMDIFLFSQCRFFVGVSSGPILNPILFGVPTIMTNFMPITGRPHASNCLYIPKLLWFNEHERFATFPEILSSELGRMFTTHGYTEKNIKIIENSPDELNDVVTEMLDRLDQCLEYTNEDNLLQEKLNELYRKYSGYGDMGRIGQKFIDKYSRMGLL